MCKRNRARSGFTLVEVVVAIVLLAIGILALASGAAFTVRSMADAARITDASLAAERDRERAYSTACAAGSGVDTARGARITWTASPSAPLLSMQQLITLPRTAPAVVTLTAAGACR